MKCVLKKNSSEETYAYYAETNGKHGLGQSRSITGDKLMSNT